MRVGAIAGAEIGEPQPPRAVDLLGQQIGINEGLRRVVLEHVRLRLHAVHNEPLRRLLVVAIIQAKKVGEERQPLTQVVRLIQPGVAIRAGHGGMHRKLHRQARQRARVGHGPRQ